MLSSTLHIRPLFSNQILIMKYHTLIINRFIGLCHLDYNYGTSSKSTEDVVSFKYISKRDSHAIPCDSG